MMATSTSFDWVIVVLAGCGHVRTGVTCAASGSVSPCGYSYGLDPLRGSVCEGAAGPRRRGRPPGEPGLGAGGDDGERETHSFLLQLSAPTVELLLSRKISSVEYAMISSLQDTF